MQPENLLLDSQGNLKISDFGLSALPQQIRVRSNFMTCIHQAIKVWNFSEKCTVDTCSNKEYPCSIIHLEKLTISVLGYTEQKC